jgi:membrane associated rhomboid family serine protease
MSAPEPDSPAGGTASPFHRLPPLIVVLVLVLLGIEAVFQAGAHGLAGGAQGLGWRMAAVQRFGFSDALFEHMATTRRLPAEGVWRFLTYGFVHASLTHAIFGAVLLLALGKAVSEVFSVAATVAILLAGAVAGALAYALFQDSRAMLIGIYPAVWGLLGAYTWGLWRKADATGRARLMAFRLVALLLFLQLFFRLTFGGGNEWVADLGGFLAGFGLSFLVAPDAPDRLRSWRDRARDR